MSSLTRKTLENFKLDGVRQPKADKLFEITESLRSVVSVDDLGNVYQVLGSDLIKYTPRGDRTILLSNVGVPYANCRVPVKDNYLILPDIANKKILKIDLNSGRTLFEIPFTDTVRDIVVASNDEIYFITATKLYKIDINGSLIDTGRSGRFFKSLDCDANYIYLVHNESGTDPYLYKIDRADHSQIYIEIINGIETVKNLTKDHICLIAGDNLASYFKIYNKSDGSFFKQITYSYGNVSLVRSPNKSFVVGGVACFQNTGQPFFINIKNVNVETFTSLLSVYNSLNVSMDYKNGFLAGNDSSNKVKLFKISGV
ncbi:hypothetical protein [Wukongibacter sp. M2B1]|uniref:hypothetical protein n=1 Tax=Wukongibacter sp. M2B1 TaxID=3088895 RepID=UPI003D797E9C